MQCHYTLLTSVTTLAIAELQAIPTAMLSSPPSYLGHRPSKQ